MSSSIIYDDPRFSPGQYNLYNQRIYNKFIGIGTMLQSRYLAFTARSQYLSIPKISRVTLFSKKLVQTIQDRFKPVVQRTKFLRASARIHPGPRNLIKKYLNFRKNRRRKGHPFRRRKRHQ